MIHHQIAILDNRAYYRLVPTALSPSVDRICYQSVVHHNELYSELFDVEYHRCTVSSTITKKENFLFDENVSYVNH